jgi:hypothetical protein
LPGNKKTKNLPIPAISNAFQETGHLLSNTIRADKNWGKLLLKKLLTHLRVVNFFVISLWRKKHLLSIKKEKRSCFFAIVNINIR